MLIALQGCPAHADTPAPGTVILKGATDNTKIGNVSDALKVNITASALPSGAATNSALTAINTTLGSPFQVGGSIANTSFGISGTLPAFAATPTVNAAQSGAWSIAQKGTLSANAPVVNSYSSTNVTTSAYTQLVASTSNAVNSVEVFDSSGQSLYFAVGASGSEVNQFVIFPGGNGKVSLSIPVSSRVSVKAISATANAGSLLINFYQ